MIQVKATATQQRPGLDGPMIDGRLEIRWAPSEPWLNLGLFPFQLVEWKLLVMLLRLGALRTRSVELIYE